jgi:hypothetical protein
MQSLWIDRSTKQKGQDGYSLNREKEKKGNLNQKEIFGQYGSSI